ncbi:MAG TPA: hypothetical protein VHE99_05935 [Gammaproteobacteria bacterium]|nr:hypothetical protein [Gammaproteobacteria bacterium]
MKKKFIKTLKIALLSLSCSVAFAENYICPPLDVVNKAQGANIQMPYGELVLASPKPDGQKVVSLNNAQILARIPTQGYFGILVSCAYNYDNPDEIFLVYDLYGPVHLYTAVTNNWWENAKHPDYAVCQDKDPANCVFTDKVQ